mgnify:FL=1
MTTNLYDDVGGRPCIERVHKRLYDKLLSHPWLKDFFKGNDRNHLESQQTEFMMLILGGPKIYGGRPPATAHCHMFVTEEIFLIRHELLSQSLTEAGVSPEHKLRWLEFDYGFKAALVKNSIDECEGRYKSEPIIVVEKPL